jgi:hypothetical protein
MMKAHLGIRSPKAAMHKKYDCMALAIRNAGSRVRIMRSTRFEEPGQCEVTRIDKQKKHTDAWMGRPERRSKTASLLPPTLC